jgi:hypothetical protein
MSKLKIFPSIGVARIGNSSEFYIGPEQPGIPSNWDPSVRKFKRFKDRENKILRQAARFRIFEFDEAGNPTRELTLGDGVKIEWRVHVANRKASFFSFNAQNGARRNGKPPYADRVDASPNAIEKPRKGRGQPEIKNRRNANVANRKSLEIDPGVVSINAPGSIDLVDRGNQTGIDCLGQLRMQDDGRLLFLGGFGKTAKMEGASPLEEYANNDGWFDDMCDGSIQAKIAFTDGRIEEAQSAWVIVGPPDFAPAIGNVVSLYDTILDIAVRNRLLCQPGNDPVLKDIVAQQQAWQDGTNDFSDAYTPSFKEHVYPILARALAAVDVHESSRRSYHTTLMDWKRLGSAGETAIRSAVFNRIRDPNSSSVDRDNMPRGLGDEFNALDESEEDPVNFQPTARAFLSLTKVQFAILKAWKDGKFKADWNLGDDVKYAPIPAPQEVTPHGLNIAGLENCVGGPFFPGIEVGWLIRETELYDSAFRLKEPGFSIGPLTFEGGFFSQQMALPWQADFYDCHREDHTPEGAAEKIYYMWWTAQRPDNIRADANSEQRRWVAAFDENKDADAEDPDDIVNLARFEQMRTRWPELSFIVLEDDEHVEQK